jgi:hypothetical protein
MKSNKPIHLQLLTGIRVKAYILSLFLTTQSLLVQTVAKTYNVWLPLLIMHNKVKLDTDICLLNS